MQYSILKGTLLTAFFLISINGWAGSEGGGGGNAVVCRNQVGRIQKAELLDYYEARVMRGINISLGSPGMTRDQVFQVALDRIGKVNPSRAVRYSKWYQEFFQDSREVPGIRLVSVPDSDHLGMPEQCSVEQVVIQKKPQFKEDKLYTINKDIWIMMNSENQAGLVLHELIYRESMAGGAKDSVASRYFNSLIASNGLQQLDFAAQVTLYRQLNFLDMDMKGGNFSAVVSPTSIFTSTELVDGQLVHAATVIGAKVNISGTTYAIGSRLWYYDNGNISNVLLSGPDVQNISVGNWGPIPCTSRGEETSEDMYYRYNASFFSSGSLRYCHVVKGRAFNGPFFQLVNRPGYLKFDEKGSLLANTNDLGVDYLLTGNILVRNNWISAKVSELYPSGLAKDFITHSDLVLPSGVQNEVPLRGTPDFDPAHDFSTSYHISLYEDGSLKSGVLKGKVPLSVGNKRVSFISEKTEAYDRKRNCSLTVRSAFYPSGQPKYGMLGEKAKLIDDTGREKEFKSGTVVFLNEKGQVYDSGLTPSDIKASTKEIVTRYSWYLETNCN